jgi:ribosomal protein S18 acetylase RimI-like enzyme
MLKFPSHSLVNLSTRPATGNDLPFLYQLHEQTMRIYIEKGAGAWQKSIEQDTIRKELSSGDMQIIQIDEVPVGVISVQARAEELFLSMLEILPQYQKKGIGTFLLENIQKEAAFQKIPVALQVHQTNAIAQTFYFRLGFQETGRNRTHLILAWYPASLVSD